MLQAEPSLKNSNVFSHAMGMRLFDPINDSFLQCCTCRWRPCQVSGPSTLTPLYHKILWRTCFSSQRTTTNYKDLS